jgi:two-component system chemotaxis sensor kinase CheA
MSQQAVAPARGSQIDKYKQAFQEEAREVLVELEATLLELNESPSDSELVGKAFRALHTIKGSGSMFGFEEIAAFTHNLENAFDEVRNGRLPVTSELVDLSLAALDQIKAMLDQAVGRGAADAGACAGIVQRLLKLTGEVEAGPASGLKEQPGEAACVPVSPAADAISWRIAFAPGPDLLRNGTDPLLLLRELRQLGELRVTADMSDVPPIADLEPERCYIRWEMTLTTAAAREAIDDVFIFAEDECEVTIEPVMQPRVEPTLASPDASEPARRFSRRSDDRDGLSRRAPATPEEPARKFGRRSDDRDGSSIRVPTVKLDQFVDLVGELVTVQARLGEVASRGEDPDVMAVSEEVERLTSALRENSMSIRMLPIRGTFERFRRLVHDLARDLHKEVELTLEGADTELDKTVIDQLNDPLMHLIRNSMDHGIEPPEARLAAGKPRAAAIRLVARYSGANVLIEVSDDGGGVNAEAVRERAVSMGLIAADAQLAEAQIVSLILSPGFSTARKITDVSGRGVGMDVVRQSVEALRGTIHVASKPGVGTNVTLRLPLTLAIIDGLLVRVGQAFFVLPLANSLECIELTREDIAQANGRHVANVRGEIIPYIRLREHFDIRTERPEREQIMIAETEDGRCGFVVDEVLGDHQTVIKNLGHFYRHVQFISGATILGDGTVALILDPDRVIQDALRSSRAAQHGPAFLPQPAYGANAGLQLNSS